MKKYDLFSLSNSVVVGEVSVDARNKNMSISIKETWSNKVLALVLNIIEDIAEEGNFNVVVDSGNNRINISSVSKDYFVAMKQSLLSYAGIIVGGDFSIG